jgi:hypothetical protein
MVGYSSYNYYNSNPNSVSSLSIYVQLQSSNTQNPLQTNSISFGGTSNELYVPPNTSESFYIEFDQNGNSLPIGSYTATVFYYLNSAPTYGNDGILTGGTPIGLSPFNFKIETPKVLSQEIAQNPPNANITIVDFVVTVFIAVILSVAITFVIATKTRLLKSLKKSGGLIAILSLIFTIVGLIIELIK